MGAWDFVINLSGSDLPLRDVDDTAAMLASARGHNFMRQNGNWKDRSDKPTDFSVWYGCGGHVYNVSYRGKRPDWTDMHSTSQWAVFSRDFIELVVSPDRGIFMNNLHFFASTCIIPDESYLASMLKISPFRNTYIHGNLHHLKQFARKDDRGFCRHTEDIDFCGQGPGIFEPKDTEVLSNIANQLFFARKFDSDPENPVRLFALNQVSGQYYEFLRKNFISEEMLRQLIKLALQTEYGDEWEEEVQVMEVLKLRALPMLLPIDPCCMPIYHTKHQMFKDTRYWIDFLVSETSTGEQRALRTSFIPQSRHQCFSRGQIKGLYLTTKHAKDKKTQVQPSSPIPTEAAGGSTLYLASYINLSDDMLPAPECNEVDNLPDDSYDGRSPDSFSFTTFGNEKTAENHAVHFNASLINPEGEVRCFIDVIITFKKAHPSVQKSDTVRFINTLMCGNMEPGLWTLVLFERGVREPFPYTIQIFLVPDRPKGWLDFTNREDELHNLWAVEMIRELGEEEYPFLAHKLSNQPRQPWQQREEEQANRAMEEDEDGEGEGDEDGNYGDAGIRNGGRGDPGGGEDKQSFHEEDEDEAEGEDSSNGGRKERINGHLRVDPNRLKLEAHRKLPILRDEETGRNRGIQNMDRLKREETGREFRDTLRLSGNRREDGGFRKVKGHNDGSLNAAQMRDESLPTWLKNQSFALTFMEFVFISVIVFILVKGVLVPLRIVKRKSHGVKSFATFLVVVTFIQFLVYSMFVLSASS
ncbi:uncharacterized protein LOC121424745 [Lytechinus variegatus]|uniref:uncharacterized protein LOC121424745 n=1 Tax=Lytechinus variegatus TaxID=7654 RepID=UPI001BB11E4F|nr:uncharacterized protein LOC121424745 [Lytechinus variegatus]